MGPDPSKAQRSDISVPDILFRYAREKESALKKSGTLFAHYTSAYAAMQILKGRQLWLRNAALMNDYLEVQYGRASLIEALRLHGERFCTVFLQSHPGVVERALGVLDERDFFNNHQTYLSSLCEHDPTNDLGLLSMWRAYGGATAGVALIFKPDFLDLDTSPLRVWSSPVLYGREAFVDEFEKLTELAEKNTEVFNDLSSEDLEIFLYNSLQSAILSCKHEGFAEEREWRLIHSPSEGLSPFVPCTVEAVRDRAEIVHHLPIDKSDELPGLRLTDLLDRVIIGPCEHPIQMAMAFQQLLADIGFDDPDKYIRISNIPLRQRG